MSGARDAAYAAREILAFDENAHVRAGAALSLAKMDPDVARPALHDALDDEMPVVRHAAARALARTGGSLDRLASVALEDPIWWVRRAAVVTSAMLGESAAIPTLRAALDDPFWRVRSAAVRSLLALDQHDLISKLGPATTARSEGALSYIARRLGADVPDGGPTEIEVHNAIVARLDPDPAVAAARVDRGDPVTTAFLVECLGDPHRSLRASARKRLRRSHDLRAFELALLWLDEPRIPHAAQTVVRLLDSLDREDIEPLLDIVFERGGAGALCWALSYVGLTGDASRDLEPFARSEHALVRCAAIEAMGALGEAFPEGLRDPDPRVVRSTVLSADPSALAGFTSTDPIVKRALVFAADARGDVEALLAFSSDPDPRTRAMAIEARAKRDDRDPAWHSDPDPWVRIAAMNEASAERALASDPHPSVRRAAFRLKADSTLAARSGDPWLQTRACALLDPRKTDDLVLLLGMARSPSQAVRAAAADALQRTDIDSALDGLLASDRLSDDERIAALAHRSRFFDDADFDRLRLAREKASPAVRAWIQDVVEPGPEAPRPAVSRTEAPLRDLGATGIRISSLVVSGAGMLPSRAYTEAAREGCNVFFWEPRYHPLGRMLARDRDRDLKVVCGTYEASERAIVADVDRYLRRLHRDALDVFLLFWVRSPSRIASETFEVLSKLKTQGKIRAFGFSTHDRGFAVDAMHSHAWDVIMTRHSAAHPGAETNVFPLAREKNVGILGFSALSYGRVLSPDVSASDAYRYSLAQPGVSAVLTAPRTAAELQHNLSVLRAPPLASERQHVLREWGKTVHAESRDFARSIRRHPLRLSDATADLGQWLDREEVLDPRFE